MNADTKKLTIHKLPQRIKKSVIYEVNIRQYTKEGTFAAFEKHLPRLKQLGIDIIWLMPIQPVGEKNRKGTLGSYYSVKDYTAINPEFGTKEEFNHLIETIHALDMIVLLDWVANHSAWDNVWTVEHPEWYMRDKKGNILPPNEDWTDVAHLNYNNIEMRRAMIEAMKYWLWEFDVDGFRCDMAMLVPTDFWEETRKQLDKIKPVFMLAEAEEFDLMKSAFDMNYSWELLHLTEDIAQEKKKADCLIDYFLYSIKKFPNYSIKMNFTSNHDENSWQGSEYERFPNGSFKVFAAFSFVIPGMPLIYSGQEVCLKKKLEFFEKDEIEWKDCAMSDFYKKLADLKMGNEALWTGEFGGNIELLPTETNERITTFVRQKNGNKVVCLFNLSDFPTRVKYITSKAVGNYINYFTGKEVEINLSVPYKLAPWEYWVLISK